MINFNLMKQLIYWIKLFLLLQFLFFLFALISALLPSGKIIHNIRLSAKEYKYTNMYETPFIRSVPHQSDNFTDFLILTLNYHVESKKPLKHVMIPEGKFSNEDLLEATTHLNHSIKHRGEENTFFYGRYWHGSTFFYRWLLLAGSYSTVRYINFILTSLVLFGFCRSLGKRLNGYQFYGLLGGMVLVNFYMIFMSMQFAPVFIVTMIGSIFLLKRMEQNKSVVPLFFILGALTCYFDLLTVPIISLGIPMLVWACVKEQDGKLVKSILEIIKNSVIWGIGYVGSWSFKWLLIAIFTNHSIAEEVSGKLTERAGVWKGSRMDVLPMNFDLLELPLFYIVIAVLGLLITFFFTQKRWYLSVLFLFIALMPIAWLLVTAQHAQLHNWFTYRSLWVTLSGVLLALANLVDWEKVNRLFKKREVA